MGLTSPPSSFWQGLWSPARGRVQPRAGLSGMAHGAQQSPPTEDLWAWWTSTENGVRPVDDMI